MPSNPNRDTDGNKLDFHFKGKNGKRNRFNINSKATLNKDDWYIRKRTQELVNTANYVVTR